MFNDTAKRLARLEFGNAERTGDGELAAVLRLHNRRFDMVSHAVERGAGVGLGGLRQAEQKFLATISVYRIVRPKAVHQNAGYGRQDPVTGLMAVGVIDLFEMIDIGECQTDWLMRAIGALLLAREIALHALAGMGPGQRIQIG